MGLAFLNDYELTNIGNAIREKRSETDLYLPQEMPEKILGISTAPAFDWGSEDDLGDSAWWEALKAWIPYASTDELDNCVGKTKLVQLTSAVLGTTLHYVRCIGYNRDRDNKDPERNTLTFQTKNCLSQYAAFDTSGYVNSWYSS